MTAVVRAVTQSIIAASVIGDYAGKDAGLARATVLTDLPGIDSLSRVEIAFELEERFDIEIGDAEIEERFKTVGDVIDLVAEKIAGRAP